jgi:Skp family chaperone for outer membrane proteins
MKKCLSALIAVVLIIGLGCVAAAKAEGDKFGYVDFNRALNEVEEGKQTKAALKAEFEKKQKQLELMQTELKTMQADLEKQKLILSAEAMKTKEEAFRNKFIEVNQKLAQYREEMAKREVEATGKILTKLRDIVRSIGQSEDYTMILEKSQDIVIYSPAGADLTSRVISQFDKGK